MTSGGASPPVIHDWTGLPAISNALQSDDERKQVCAYATGAKPHEVLSTFELRDPKTSADGVDGLFNVDWTKSRQDHGLERGA